MEAIQALQLQTDAKHRRITSQVMLEHGCANNGQNESLLGVFLIEAFRNLVNITVSATLSVHGFLLCEDSILDFIFGRYQSTSQPLA